MKPLLFLLSLMFFCSIPLISQDTHPEIDSYLKNLIQKNKDISLTIEEYRITDQYISPKNNVEHIYFVQTMNGIDIHLASGALHLNNKKELVSDYHHFILDIENKMNGVTRSPRISALDALVSASKEMGYRMAEKIDIVESPGGVTRKMMYGPSGISRSNIPLNLKYYQDENHNISLAWELFISSVEGFENWKIFIDAGNGALLEKRNMTYECFLHTHDEDEINNNQHQRSPADPAVRSLLPPTNSYNVFPYPVESPNFGVRSIVSNVANPIASPYGWHDIDGMPGHEFTNTFGNNVRAFSDRNADLNPDPSPGAIPDGGINLEFDFPLDLSLEPVDNQLASNTNAFYANNFLHDVLYQYGFDEVSGNFQENNYGKGGLGNDPVIAYGQFGADNGNNCNAVFFAPPDGMSGLTATFICDRAVPSTDAAFDNGVLAHEYGHGISVRMAGGPANSECLGGKEQMGEGWSDYFSLIMTMEPGDQKSDAITVGTYLLGQDADGPGTRTPPFNAGKPYSPDFSVNDQTYGSLRTESFSVPHGVGTLWAEILWEMTWALIDEYGWDPDIYNGSGGNNLALQLVVESFRYIACQPGFIDGRDAILLADTVLYNGENACLLWEAFARRGLGYSASQGSTFNIIDGVEAFDLPPGCGFKIDKNYHSICGTGNLDFTLTTGQMTHRNNHPITLSTSGLPSGVSATFDVNPINAGTTSKMTISVDGSAAPGQYDFLVKAFDLETEQSIPVTINIANQSPQIPTLDKPLSGRHFNANPELSWIQDPAADSFLLEVTTDPTFQNFLVDTTVQELSFRIQNIPTDDTFYWRVRAKNECGISPYSITGKFVVRSAICETFESTDVPLDIEARRGEYFSYFEYSESGIVTDIDVTNILMQHGFNPYVDIKLISPQGTVVNLFEATCYNVDDVNLSFDDEAAETYPCPANDGGTYLPIDLLSAFDGENPRGIWTLKLTVRSGGEIGTLSSWGLAICASQPLNIPTLGQWAVFILSLLLLITGLIYIKSWNYTFN